ncbi:MAG: beta-N-acetylglucosaminidase domain-containing protein [Alphaproteobacteria bacterium]
MKKVCGIVEGLFTAPATIWSWKEREKVVEDSLKQGVFNTYFYCPKDDPYVRLKWNELYPKEELKALQRFSVFCKKKNIDFVYGLNPSLLSSEMNDEDFREYLKNIKQKVNQLYEAGVKDFCLLYDDIPFAYNALQGIDSTEASDYGKLHSKIANEVFISFSGFKTFWFCGAEYFFTKRNKYLDGLLERLDKPIPLIWTGNSVFTKRITNEMTNTALKTVNNRPLIWWDNYPVNDDMKLETINLGGFNEPEKGCLDKLAGILVNPLRENLLSIPNIQSFLKWWENPSIYNRKKDYLILFKKDLSINTKTAKILIEFSGKSVMDNLRFNVNGTFSDEEIESALKETKTLKKDILDELLPIKKSIENYLSIKQEMNFEFLERYLDFPIYLSASYLNRVFLILLQKRFVYNNESEKYRNIAKDILELKRAKCDDPIFNKITFAYNEYRFINKRNLELSQKQKIEKVLAETIVFEKKEFTNWINKSKLSINEKMKIIALYKSANQHNINDFFSKG